jgi:hypothetical protein
MENHPMNTASSLPDKPSHVDDTASSNGKDITCRVVRAETASQAAGLGRCVLSLIAADPNLGIALVPCTYCLTATRGGTRRSPPVRASICACSFQRRSKRRQWRLGQQVRSAEAVRTPA